MIPWILQQVQNNQILQAAVFASPAAILTYSVRSLPGRIWRGCRSLATMELSINSDAGDYHAMVGYVSEHVVSERWTRRYSYHAEASYDFVNGGQVAKHMGLRAGYGQHWGWFGRSPVIVSRNMSEVAGTEKFKETLHLTFMTRSRGVVRKFSAAMREAVSAGRREERVDLFMSSGTWWQAGGSLPLRSMNTVFTNGGADQLLAHIRRFERDREIYRRRGMPWHTGALLTGEPGTGKTSLIHAIASETKRSIRYLSLGSVESDRQLIELIASRPDWDRALLVIEDADVAGAAVARSVQPAVPDGAAPGEQRTPVTLSALLNTLDGLITPDGLVVIATTNHPDRLDPALRRPGRFDLTLELGPLEWREFAAMAALFDVAPADLDSLRSVYRPIAGAKLRALLIEDGIDAARRHFERPAPSLAA